MGIFERLIFLFRNGDGFNLLAGKMEAGWTTIAAYQSTTFLTSITNIIVVSTVSPDHN
jgi:hypothetical protein